MTGVTASEIRKEAEPRLSAWIGLALILLVNCAYIYNNLAPFLGFNYIGAMNMFSGMDAASTNHLFLPRLSLTHDYDFAQVLRAAWLPPGAATSDELRTFLQFAREREWVNLNLVHYQVDRFCRATAGGRLMLALRRDDGVLVQYENACTTPSARRFALVTSYLPCRFGCQGLLQRWARGELNSP